MDKREYEKIINNIVLPIAEEILESPNNKRYKTISLIKDFDYKFLNEINKLISFLKKSAVATEEIDRHKMAACLMCAIIKYAPFKIVKKGYGLEDLFYANELLGIYSAVSLLECSVPNLKITFPRTKYESRDIDPYIKTLCTSLYIGKNEKQLKYCILYLANILFLLESNSMI